MALAKNTAPRGRRAAPKEDHIQLPPSKRSRQPLGQEFDGLLEKLAAFESITVEISEARSRLLGDLKDLREKRIR